MRISDWSSDVCSSDLHDTAHCRNGRILLDDTDMAAKRSTAPFFMTVYRQEGDGINYVTVRNVYMPAVKIGRASCRERVCQYVSISVVAVALKKKTQTKQQLENRKL